MKYSLDIGPYTLILDEVQPLNTDETEFAKYNKCAQFPRNVLTHYFLDEVQSLIREKLRLDFGHINMPTVSVH
jgi:hypothetical protein